METTFTTVSASVSLALLSLRALFFLYEVTVDFRNLRKLVTKNSWYITLPQQYYRYPTSSEKVAYLFIRTPIPLEQLLRG
jgi:hypothetical protein